MKKRTSLMLSIVVAFFPLAAFAAWHVTEEAKTSTVLIANYNADNKFLGWGSGFFVDEGIVVTNDHVIEEGNWYRVYATGTDGTVDLNCYKAITKADVKVNLDDDVAYMRAFLPCDHGVVDFTDDPKEGDPVWVIGYPYHESFGDTLDLSVSTGSVLGTADGWLVTDAALDFGSSGGPVMNENGVLGVAVAKSVDEQGNFEVGYFIPSSVILRGLLSANNSDFGYIPRVHSSSSSSLSSASSSSQRSSSSSSIRSSSSSRSSAYVSPLQARTCSRVAKEIKSASILERLNVRLLKHYGFQC